MTIQKMSSSSPGSPSLTTAAASSPFSLFLYRWLRLSLFLSYLTLLLPLWAVLWSLEALCLILDGKRTASEEGTKVMALEWEAKKEEGDLVQARISGIKVK